jgi:hypothetical protein
MAKMSFGNTAASTNGGKYILEQTSGNKEEDELTKVGDQRHLRSVESFSVVLVVLVETEEVEKLAVDLHVLLGDLLPGLLQSRDGGVLKSTDDGKTDVEVVQQ